MGLSNLTAVFTLWNFVERVETHCKTCHGTAYAELHSFSCSHQLLSDALRSLLWPCHRLVALCRSDLFFFYGATARYRALASLIKPLHSRLDSRFQDTYIFMVRGRQPLAQPPTWRTRVYLLVWIIPFDLSSLGGPTSSYATAGIALRVIWPHKPHHYIKVETPWGGGQISALTKLQVLCF
jgi:hypothetical protein